MSYYFYILLTILLPYFPVFGVLAFASCKGLGGTTSPQTECASFVELRTIKFFFNLVRNPACSQYWEYQAPGNKVVIVVVFLDIDG